MTFRRTSLNISVKQALDDTMRDGNADYATICVEDNGDFLGGAKDYHNALIVFEKFLSLTVIDYWWGSKNGKTGVDIIVDEDDYYELRHGEEEDEIR